MSKHSEKKWGWSAPDLLGPTTLHLQHEFYLWMSLSILTVSSLQSLYRGSFGLKGDYIYCSLVSLWLSRHLIVRWLCTQDMTTLKSPNILGVISHWCTSLVMAGQYFDRPDHHVVAKQVGGSLAEESATTLSLILPSILYSFQWFKVRIMHPLMYQVARGQTSLRQSPTDAAEDNACGGSSRRENSDSSSQRRNDHGRSAPSSTSTALRRELADIYTHIIAFWNRNGPPSHLVVVVTVFLLCCWSILDRASTKVAGPYTTYALNIGGGKQSDWDDADNPAKGLYVPLVTPTWGQIISLMACGTTMASILLYGRITLPIPDLVAGSNVLKAVRVEARGSTSTGGKSSKTKMHKEEASWSEQYKPITSENRLRLASKVALLRVLDALVCCALLPRTPFLCRVTKHCPAARNLWELSKIIHPAGVTSSYRSDGAVETTFGTLRPDVVSTLMGIVSIVLISIFLLMAQLVTLNKSYLAILGYISGEWKLVENFKGSTSPPAWDPRRRYKKGDLIMHSYPGSLGNSVYMATSNSPEGRPFDLFLRATHDFFQFELGHSSTSCMIAALARFHTVFISCVFLTLFHNWLFSNSIDSLCTIMFANIIAYYGLSRVGLMDHSELRSIAAEINKGK